MTRVALLLALLAGPAAHATGVPATPGLPRDHARIDGAAAMATQGRIAVNQAAGTGNAQANLAALATSSGIGVAGATAQQHVLPTHGGTRALGTTIGADAFRAVQGLVSVNQVAGSGNAQANLFALGTGTGPAAFDAAPLDDGALADVAGAPLNPALTMAPSAPRTVEIAASAFRGGQGVVQVNQTAGVGNQSTNAVVLQLPGGTPP